MTELKEYNNDQISRELARYIMMCRSAKDELDSTFSQGDFFWHEDFGINRVSKRDYENNCLLCDKYPERDISVDDCVFIPTREQLEHLVLSNIQVLEEGKVLSDIKKQLPDIYGSNFELSLPMPEEQLLVYFMYELNKKMLYFKDGNWIWGDIDR